MGDSRKPSIFVVVLTAAAVVVAIVSVRAWVISMVEWGKAVPWEDGYPLVGRVEGMPVPPPGSLLLIPGGDAVGAVTAIRGTGADVTFELQVRRNVRFPDDTRFVLRMVAGEPAIMVIRGASQLPLRQWDEVRVEPAP